ncbi:hypothetical protein GQ457_12G009970 [Hibiscus cannabinus]
MDYEERRKRRRTLGYLWMLFDGATMKSSFSHNQRSSIEDCSVGSDERSFELIITLGEEKEDDSLCIEYEGLPIIWYYCENPQRLDIDETNVNGRDFGFNLNRNGVGNRFVTFGTDDGNSNRLKIVASNETTSFEHAVVDVVILNTCSRTIENNEVKESISSEALNRGGGV